MNIILFFISVVVFLLSSICFVCLILFPFKVHVRSTSSSSFGARARA